MFTVNEAENFLEETKKYGSVLGLDNMENLMKELNSVQDKLLVIHVAGTNGKGSVCAMLTSILCEAGYKTGTYTSPMVFAWEEQYAINRKSADNEQILPALYQVKQACERLSAKGKNHPTIFEVETALAFVLFYREKCQYVILETGLGGETDATNVVEKPLCSVFTSISMDHMGFLGNTMEEIAKIKAGIIKEGCPVISVTQKDEAAEILNMTARNKKTTVVFADSSKAAHIRREGDELLFDYEDRANISLHLVGSYQIENSICVLETVKQLNRSGACIDENAIRKGLFHARWPGRFEKISDEPLFYIDGAHNEAAAKALFETLENDFTNREKIYIIGVLADKEHDKILRKMLPLAKKVYTVTPNHIRALDGRILCEKAKSIHNDVHYMADIKSALHQALIEADQQTMIVAFGSLSYLGEIKKQYGKKKQNDR